MKLVVVTRSLEARADGNYSGRHISYGELLFLEESCEDGPWLVNDGSKSFRLPSACLEEVP